MTKRHRFKGALGDLCADDFGGVARCALPLGSPYHWQDHDHPFTTDVEGGDGCKWRLYGEGVRECDVPQDSFAHQATEEVRGSVSDAPTVTFVLPDNVGAPVFPESEVLAEEAEQYKWGDPWGAPDTREDRSYLSDDELVEWERAVRWLLEEGVELTYGPWPVRKFVLRDAGRGSVSELRGVLLALNELESEHCLMVTRPDGAPYRVALVTWGMMLGMDLAACAEEIEKLYG